MDGFERWMTEFQSIEKSTSYLEDHERWGDLDMIIEGGNHGMAIDHVSCAIASFWAPLGTRFGFGHANVFDIRNREAQMALRTTACGQHEERFIMPLHFADARQQRVVDQLGTENGKKKGKAMRKDKGKGKTNRSKPINKSQMPTATGSKPTSTNDMTVTSTRSQTSSSQSSSDETEGMGHILLVVGSKILSGKANPDRVGLQIWDSSPGHVDKKRIEEVATSVVQYSGWMGQDVQSRVWDIGPNLVIKSRKFESCPDQGARSLHCGLYAVLNAWALMLNVTVTKLKNLKLPDDQSLRDFHRIGVMMLNLAVAGCMDTVTVQVGLRHTFSSVLPLPTLVNAWMTNARCV